MPLNELAVSNRVVGERQVRKALKEQALLKVFAAMDADSKRIDPLLELAKHAKVQVEMAPNREILGRACAISRGASIAGILKV